MGTRSAGKLFVLSHASPYARLTAPSMIPSPRSGCVQRCSEESTSFRALFWALELNEKIFSLHKQALNSRIRWPAVTPLFLLFKSINYRD